MRVRYSTKHIISVSIVLILLFSLVPFKVAHASTVDRILGQNFYFHRDLSGIESYRVLDAINPTKKDNNTIVQDIPIGVWEVGDGWISPAVQRDINLSRAYNFLFSVWGAGNGSATLFFKFYAYRSNNEHFLFTSNPSEQLIVNATEMLWQHKTKEVILQIKAGDWLVLRLFINVTAAGRFGLGYDCTQYPSYVNDPTETRYMRSDDIISGYYNFGTSQTSSSLAYEASFAGSRTVYWGMRVWKRTAIGGEYEITSGTPVAQVSRSANGVGYQSAIWNCSTTALVSTDRILIRIYEKIIISSAWISVTSLYGMNGWLTEELGATQLDEASWNVTYHTERDYDGIRTYGIYVWGSSTFNCHVENFKWTSAISKVWNTVATWSFSLVTRLWQTAATWSFSLIARIWNSITAWNFSLITRIWNAVAAWSFTLLTRIWNDLSTWSLTLTVKEWFIISSWQFSLNVRQWVNIGSFFFSLSSLGWHLISLWILGLQPPSRSGFLLIAIVIGVILSLGFVRVFASKKRKTTQTSAEMLYRLSYRIRKKGSFQRWFCL